MKLPEDGEHYSRWKPFLFGLFIGLLLRSGFIFDISKCSRPSLISCIALSHRMHAPNEKRFVGITWSMESMEFYGTRLFPNPITLKSFLRYGIKIMIALLILYWASRERKEPPKVRKASLNSSVSQAKCCIHNIPAFCFAAPYFDKSHVSVTSSLLILFVFFVANHRHLCILSRPQSRRASQGSSARCLSNVGLEIETPQVSKQRLSRRVTLYRNSTWHN